MTEIRWYQEKALCGVQAKGHAEFNPGNDIVCSAISALLQTLYAGLEMRCYARVHHEQESGWFCIDVGIEEKNRDRIEALFNSVIYGLELIAEKYPNNVKIERVKMLDTV
jgi:uncharacterized protein YsxB (DUF464 family)